MATAKNAEKVETVPSVLEQAEEPQREMERATQKERERERESGTQKEEEQSPEEHLVRSLVVRISSALGELVVYVDVNSWFNWLAKKTVYQALIKRGTPREKKDLWLIIFHCFQLSPAKPSLLTVQRHGNLRLRICTY